MGKTSAEVKNRYNAKVYDQLAIRVPKGRRADIEAFARDHGESINGMVNRLIQNEMSLSDTEWGGEPKMRTLAQLRRILNDHGYGLRKKNRGEDSWLIIDGIKKAGDTIGNGCIVAGNENGDSTPGLSTEEVADWIAYMGWSNV